MILETPNEIKGKEFILVGPSGGIIDLREVEKKFSFTD